MAVCRFAPSPTGRLHLGGARTALFNWAWARHAGGTFLLRIEDTDRQRSLPEHEEAIIAALDWLGLERDGPAVRQSERADLYRAAAERLVEEGKAYRCYATAAELDELRAAQERQGLKPQYDRRWRGRSDWPAAGEYCLRFATPTEGDCAISDLIRGEVSIANKEFDDPVILRADGSATYNFAAVVDDGEMGITDVIRGEDHLTNTLRQVHIHRALGQEIPRFAHLPLILGRRLDENGEPATLDSGEPAYERLSKRNMAVDVDYYRQEGFIDPAMVNYLAQLGWTQPGQEIYMPEELVEAFELSKVNKSAARFDLDRLQWVNQQHLRRLPPPEVAKRAGIKASAAAIEIGMEKARTLAELREELSWLQPLVEFDPNLQGELSDDNRIAFAALVKRMKKLEKFNQESIKQEIKNCCKEHGLKFPRLGMPLRVALTGKTKSPDVALVAEILGPETCLKRLRSIPELHRKEGIPVTPIFALGFLMHENPHGITELNSEEIEAHARLRAKVESVLYSSKEDSIELDLTSVEVAILAKLTNYFAETRVTPSAEETYNRFKKTELGQGLKKHKDLVDARQKDLAEGAVSMYKGVARCFEDASLGKRKGKVIFNKKEMKIAAQKFILSQRGLIPREMDRKLTDSEYVEFMHQEGRSNKEIRQGLLKRRRERKTRERSRRKKERS